MLSLRVVPTVLFGFTILACSQSQESVRPPISEDLSAIADAGARLKSAMSLDDVPGIMAELAEDHLTMPPDGPTPLNNQVLAEWHQARMDQFVFESVFTTDEVRLLGGVLLMSARLMITWVGPHPGKPSFSWKLFAHWPCRRQ